MYLFFCALMFNMFFCIQNVMICHSHTHLCVVDQVLQWVSTRKEIDHLLSVSDGSSIWLLRVDQPRDVDRLHIREVGEQPRSDLLSYLLR